MLRNGFKVEVSIGLDEVRGLVVMVEVRNWLRYYVYESPPKDRSTMMRLCLWACFHVCVCTTCNLFICMARSDLHSSEFLHAVMVLPP